MMTIDTLQQSDRINLYDTFAGISRTRMVADLLYESLGHTCIEGSINLALKRMAKRPEEMLVH